MSDALRRERKQVSVIFAGDHAEHLDAHTAAVTHYAAALALTSTDDPVRGRLLFGLGSAMSRATDTGDDVLASAVTMLEAVGDLGTAAEAEVLATRTWRGGVRDAWRGHLESCRAPRRRPAPIPRQGVGPGEPGEEAVHVGSTE